MKLSQYYAIVGLIGVLLLAPGGFAESSDYSPTTKHPQNSTPLEGLQPWQAEFQLRLKRVWNEKEIHRSRRATFRLEFSNEGFVSDLRIVQSSGSAEADNDAMSAIRSVSSRLPVPKSGIDYLRAQTTTVEFSNKPETQQVTLQITNPTSRTDLPSSWRRKANLSEF